MLTYKKKPLERLALLCFGGIGDVLLFSPVVKELKHWLPDIHISLLCENRSKSAAYLIEGVDTVVPLMMNEPGEKPNKRKLFGQLVEALKVRHYDAVLSTGGSPFLGLLLWRSGVGYRVGYSRLGWKNSWNRLFLSSWAELKANQYAGLMHLELAKAFIQKLITEPYSLKTQALPQLKPLSDQKLEAMDALKVTSRLKSQTSEGKIRYHILLHPGVSQLSLLKGINKTWKSTDWADLILRLSSQHWVYLAGGPDDAETIAAIEAALPSHLERFRNLNGQTRDLADLAALMQVMDAVVCVDSAPLHLATALKKPTVALFGPTDEKKLLPPVAFQKNSWLKSVSVENLPCRPCLWDKRQANCATSECLNILPEKVEAALNEVLASKKEG